MYSNRRAARGVFFAGLVLMIFGCIILLDAIIGISRLSVLWSSLCVIIGVLCAVLAIKLNKRPAYLFFAAFFMQIALFLFLSALRIVPFTLAQGWPFLAIFVGLALLPPGWRHYRTIRYRYLIPSLAFTALGCMLLVFSLKVVSFSFKQFFIAWWPLLLVLAGLLLILLSVSTKTGTRDETP
jgi:hypothetical protein